MGTYKAIATKWKSSQDQDDVGGDVGKQLNMVPVLNAPESVDLMPQYKLGISQMYSENH